MTTALRPSQAFPNLELPLVGGGAITLPKPNEAGMTVVDVYRGLHCPRCQRHLHEVASRLDEFSSAGLSVVAISTDPSERAEQAARDWGLGGLPVGYDLSIESAQALGLHISSAIAEKETRMFAEPGIFYVAADGTLYGSIIVSFPFVRPAVSDIIEVGTIARERNYPPRGTWAG